MATPSFAFQSIKFRGGTPTGTSTIPSSQPYTSNVVSWRFEARIDTYTQTSSQGGIVSIPNFIIAMQGGADNLIVTDNSSDDFGGSGNSVSVSVSGRSAFLMRVTRDVTSFYNQLAVEVWNVDGSSYAISQKQIVTPQIPINYGGGSFIVGGNNPASCSCDIAWSRWYSSILPIGSYPPHGTSGGDLADYEYEGNGVDTSGSLPTLTYSPTANYETTPTSGPASVINMPISIRAGVSNTMDGSQSYSLIDNQSLAYAWSILASPSGSSAVLSSTFSATPTFTPDKFGQYTFQLAVTDTNTVTSTTTMNIGAVFTDNNHIVNYNDSNLDFILGPALQWGYSPWPYQDKNNKDMADVYGTLVSTPTGVWVDDWDTPLGGTITVINSNPVITGGGTNFQTDFCGGGTTPSGLVYIIAWSDLINHYPMEVQSCDSATQITLSGGEANGVPTSTSVQYARTFNGVWWGGAINGVGGSNNANYYDNVVAHYSMYYRTGLTKYLTYAQTLADRWYDSPFLFRSAFPRTWSLTGIILRALEGNKSNYWTDKIYPSLDSLSTSIQTSGLINDIREDSYAVGFVALGAKTAPDSVRRSSYTVAIENAYTMRWKPQQQSGGNYWNLFFGDFSPWNGQVGTASVISGSNVVTGVGTNWQTSWNNVNEDIWFSADSAGTIGDDNNAYSYTVNSATQITIGQWRSGPSVYQGATGSGKGWSISTVVLNGWGTQPFQLGIVARSLLWVYLIDGSTDTANSVFNIENWIVNNAIQHSTKGLYYARVTPPCEPIADNIPGCSYDPSTQQGDSGIDASRFLSGETTNAAVSAYRVNQSPSIKSAQDQLLGACLNLYGGPSADPIFGCLEVQQVLDGSKPKDYGFFYGFGNSQGWAAVRLLGTTSSNLSGNFKMNGKFTMNVQ